MPHSDQIKLINHSSIFIEAKSDQENIKLLTDPWYKGLAFNNGWALLYENEISEIENLLSQVNYIYLSHEHPDHFSIDFFKKFSEIIKKKEIKIIFQFTKDKRVENFLKKIGLDLLIIKDKETAYLSEDKKIKITLFKQGHIDSAFLLESENYYHLNINDCDFLDSELNTIKKFIKNRQKKIILYIQFSYAAFRPNNEWLEKAAAYKLENIKDLYELFDCNLVIPFASFVYFCHEENYKLNEFMNNCIDTSSYLTKNKINHSFLSPNIDEISPDSLILNNSKSIDLNKEAIKFWDKKINEKSIIKIDQINKDIYPENINIFLQRIIEKNNIFLLRLIRILTIKVFFGDVLIKISDKNCIYKVNFFSVKLLKNYVDPDIEMSSDQFNFILKETYGVDTMSVNGRLKEISQNGFRKLIFAIGFTVMNQSHFGIKFTDLFNSLIINKIRDVVFRIFFKSS